MFGCLLAALQHGLPLRQLLLHALLLVLELLTLLEQWQLGIEGLQCTRSFSKIPLGLLLRLLVLLQLAEVFSGLGLRFQRTIKFRARTPFASTIGVAEGPTLANRLLNLLIKA